ncbi:MAG: hypothetical protein MUF54_18300 [Polyangiaceae bacterium]|nr:hypothetical protein [Polyangiaceae bacterium]
MSAPEDPNAGVHRLIDMVVEEVSLVDRAANKHRFLVVKRDESMADKTKKSSAKPPAAPGAPDSEGAQQVSKAIGDAIGIATTALEALTNAIEQLGQIVGDADTTPIVAELAEELSSVAGQLAAAAGVEPSTAEASGDVSTAVENVRSMLAQVAELLASSATKSDAVPALAPQPATPTDQDSTPAQPAGEPDEVSKHLASVATSLRTLTDAMKDTSQRIGRLEKGVGLPNSRQAPERPTGRPATDEVSWPLDLNRPMDRESVDKTTSFHDR